MTIIATKNSLQKTSLPPNFTFVQVREVIQLGPVFLRATLEGDDLSSHGDDSIHFRLAQPPIGTDPVWPSVAANGSVVWADGPGAIHKPVYTTRSVDHQTNRLITDIFIHEGGRTTEWAMQLLEGDNARRLVGLVGPSGGGLMPADKVLMASDETGFPAAARILENLPDGATGQVFLEAEKGAECDYPIETPAGVTLTWLSRAKGERLLDFALTALPQHSASKIWFAGEREDARKLRDEAKALGREAGDLRISGFWRR